MAALPVTNTARLFIEYTSAGHEHVAQIRLPLGSTQANAEAAYAAMAAVMAPFLHTTDRVVGARWAAAGSNLSFPITAASVVGTLGGTLDTDQKPEFISWTGRGGGGRRCRFTIFSVRPNPETVGWRNDNLSSQEAAVRSALQANPVNAVDISGQTVFWNNYVNYGYNAYFQRKMRRAFQ